VTIFNSRAKHVRAAHDAWLVPKYNKVLCYLLDLVTAHIKGLRNNPNTDAATVNSRRKMSSAVFYGLFVAAFLQASSWVVADNLLTVKLKVRDSDGAVVCALDEPSSKAMTSARMSSAPAVVACGMACTGYRQCRHFNYVSTDSLHPCHLYYYRPTQFDVQPNCKHYYTPGRPQPVTLSVAIKLPF